MILTDNTSDYAPTRPLNVTVYKNSLTHEVPVINAVTGISTAVKETNEQLAQMEVVRRIVKAHLSTHRQECRKFTCTSKVQVT
jgi:hypothetical protein